MDLDPVADWKQAYWSIQRALISGCEEAILDATSSRAANCVSWLLDNTKIDPNRQVRNTTPLIVACRDGSDKIVRMLVADSHTASSVRRTRVSVNRRVDGKLPIMIACSSCTNLELEDQYVSIVSQLLSHPDLHPPDDSELVHLLDVCSYSGDNAKLCSLLLAACNANIDIRFLFADSVARDRVQVVELLVKSHRCSISDRTYREVTDWCISRNRVEMANLLLSLRSREASSS